MNNNLLFLMFTMQYINGLEQDCIISITNAL